jgi:DNA polymerase-1
VDTHISLLLPPPSAQPKLGWRRLDANGVREKFGVPPALIADYLSLIGDTSDNIPGLTGVGPKTAVKWLEKYGGLEGVLAAADYVEPERLRVPLAAAAERLRLNRRLVTLDLTLPVPPLEVSTPRLAELFLFLEEMEMRTTLSEARRRYTEPDLFG